MKSALDQALESVVVYQEDSEDAGLQTEQYNLRGIHVGWVRTWYGRVVDAGPGRWERKMNEHVVVAVRNDKGVVSWQVWDSHGEKRGIPKTSHDGQEVDWYNLPEDWPRRDSAPKSQALSWAFVLNEKEGIRHMPRQVTMADVMRSAE